MNGICGHNLVRLDSFEYFHFPWEKRVCQQKKPNSSKVTTYEAVGIGGEPFFLSSSAFFMLYRPPSPSRRDTLRKLVRKGRRRGKEGTKKEDRRCEKLSWRKSRQDGAAGARPVLEEEQSPTFQVECAGKRRERGNMGVNRKGEEGRKGKLIQYECHHHHHQLPFCGWRE